MAEIGIEQGCRLLVEFALAKAAAEKVGHVFHAATTADILKVYSRHARVVCRAAVAGETKIGKFGVTVDKGLVAGV